MHDSNGTHDLLVFAHFNEARSFIEHFQLEQDKKGLQWQDTENSAPHVLVVGEGVFAAGDNLFAHLASAAHQYRRIINLGVCGSLDTSIVPGTLCHIRTFYLAHSQGMDFHSFSTTTVRPLPTILLHDCVTSMVRAKSSDDRLHLSAFAPLVDREGHALARVAQRFAIAFCAVKMCSDVVGETPLHCDDIRARAQEWSQGLLEHYLQHLAAVNEHTPPSQETQPQDHGWPVPLTFSQQHKLQSLLAALPSSDIVRDIPWQDWQHLRPKDRAREALLWLEVRAFPWRALMRGQLQEISAPLKKCGAHASFDAELERPGIHLTTFLANREQARQLAQTLEDIDWTSLQQLFDGEWRV